MSGRRRISRPAPARSRARARTRGVPPAIRNGAVAAGAALTLTGRGDLWTVAIAFGVADGSLLTALAVVAAAVAALARTGSAGLSDIRGAQAVLGAAGFTGAGVAVASSWASALSLVAVARNRIAGAGLGLLAGALVAGPSLSGGVGSVVAFVVSAAAGAAVGWLAAPGRRDRKWQRIAALGVGVAGVALGILAGYH